MTKSKILLYFCLSLIGGIFLSSFFKIPLFLILATSILGIIFISVFSPFGKLGTSSGREYLVIIGFCLLFLVFGIWRYQTTLSKIENSPINNFIGKEVTFIGLVDREPKLREKSTQFVIKIEKIATGARPLLIKGRILVTTWRYPEYQYLDRLKIKGKLENPQIFEGLPRSELALLRGFNYKNYLMKDGISAVTDFPEIELVNQNQGNLLTKSLVSLKNKLKEGLNNVMPRPQSAIMEALFFGEEENIPKEWKEKFNLTGTRHITAVSGMNLTIISAILLNFLLGLGFWRHHAFYLSIILIIFYILMIGAPSSVIRAGIMAILFLTAQHFGRYSSGSRVIIMAATFMLLQNPLLLRLDVGFQLSFLATLGLIYLQPPFLYFFKKMSNFFQIRNNLAATLSAQIFVLPILIYNFGQISIISPITNILILPLIPFTTILGFIFSFLGIFWQGLAQVLSWPAWFFITCILKMIDCSSKIPFFSLTLKNVHWIFLIISYLTLVSFIFWLNRKQKLKFLNY